MKHANGHRALPTGVTSAPTNTDTVPTNPFGAWDHETLARFAFEANERIKVLEADLKTAMKAYRDMLKHINL